MAGKLEKPSRKLIRKKYNSLGMTGRRGQKVQKMSKTSYNALLESHRQQKSSASSAQLIPLLSSPPPANKIGKTSASSTHAKVSGGKFHNRQITL